MICSQTDGTFVMLWYVDSLMHFMCDVLTSVCHSDYFQSIMNRQIIDPDIADVDVSHAVKSTGSWM